MEIIKEYNIQVLDDLSNILPDVEKFLKYNDLKNAITFINFAITELALNAVKAIQKRIYFREHNYDISSDYEKGVREFSNNLKFSEVNIDDILQNNRSYRIKVEINQNEKEINFRIYNNLKILPQEKDAIKNIIQKATNSNNLLGDDENSISEGAGMGLKMIILMARNMGLDEKVLEFTPGDEITEFRIIIPRSVNPDEQRAAEICKIITERIHKFPVFPENSADPGKIVNYMINNPGQIPEDSDLSSGEPVTDDTIRELYQKAIRVTGYMLYLNEKLNLGQDPKLCKITGMMHNLGKIIFNLLDEDALDKIRKITKRNKPVNENIPIEIILGISDLTLAVIMAKHWKIPENIINTVQLKNTPWKSGDNNSQLTYLLHLGLGITNYEDKNDLNHFYPQTLEELHTGYNNLKNFYESIDKKMVKQY